MNKIIIFCLLLIFIFSNQTFSNSPKLLAYIGAGLKEPVTELAYSFEKKTGIKIELTFNSSGSLLTQLLIAKKGDFYIPGGSSYLDKAKTEGAILEISNIIAYHVPVIITPIGNPKNITKVQDLARPGINVVLPDKKATAIGKTAAQIISNINLTAEIEKNTLAYVETAPKVATIILMGQGDAGITDYNNMFRNRDKLEAIEIDPKINIIDEIYCSFLTFSKEKKYAQDFMKFIEKNGPFVFEKHGFKI